MIKELVVLTLLATGSAFASGVKPDECQSFQHALADVKKDTPDIQVVELTDVQRAKVEHDYNATPPATDIHLTHVYTVGQPGGNHVLLVLVTSKDCIEDAEPVAIEDMDEILGSQS
jgi:hypothetical protein